MSRHFGGKAQPTTPSRHCVLREMTGTARTGHDIGREVVDVERHEVRVELAEAAGQVAPSRVVGVLVALPEGVLIKRGEGRVRRRLAHVRAVAEGGLGWWVEPEPVRIEGEWGGEGKRSDIGVSRRDEMSVLPGPRVQGGDYHTRSCWPSILKSLVASRNRTSCS